MRSLASALLALSACSFDTSSLAGLGGDDGPGDSDGAPGGPDGNIGPRPDAAPADAQSSSTAQVICARTLVPPALDGQPFGPWAEVELIPFQASQGELIAGAHSNYTFDAELRFGCLHDDDNVYFYIDVEDSVVIDDSLSLREDDGVVVFIDGSGDRGGTYGEDDHALMIGAEADALDYGPGDLVPEGMVLNTDDGYQVEIELDKPDIAATLPAELGFNLAIIDDDGMGNPNRDVFSLRHVPEPPACPGCCEGQPAPWCDTSVMGTLLLAD
jgi:hypothetical protein